MPYADPDRTRARQAEYRARHRAWLAAKQRARYQAYREREDARNKAYRASRPELRRALAFANRSNQRAASVGAHGKLFGRDVRMIRGSCAYCGGEASGWDHIVPLSRGGENAVANLVPCCTDCNRRKAARTPAAWRASDLQACAGAMR